MRRHACPGCGKTLRPCCDTVIGEPHQSSCRGLRHGRGSENHSTDAPSDTVAMALVVVLVAVGLFLLRVHGVGS